MSAYVALLRAVNVGGTGKLPMADLKALCENAGLQNVKTYIASGNVVFESRQSEKPLKKLIEAALAGYAGKPVGAIVRSAADMARVLAQNPYPRAAPNRTVAIFLDDAPPSDAIDQAKHRNGEEIALGEREIYVHYGDGMAQSRLVIPAARAGTARNINTVRKLADMAAAR